MSEFPLSPTRSGTSQQEEQRRDDQDVSDELARPRKRVKVDEAEASTTKSQGSYEAMAGAGGTRAAAESLKAFLSASRDSLTTLLQTLDHRNSSMGKVRAQLGTDRDKIRRALADLDATTTEFNDVKELGPVALVASQAANVQLSAAKHQIIEVLAENLTREMKFTDGDKELLDKVLKFARVLLDALINDLDQTTKRLGVESSLQSETGFDSSR